MVCSSCGHENPAERRFCSRCGTSLVASCPACGATLDAGARFCGGCGASIAPAPAAPALPTAFGGGRYTVTRLLGEGSRKRVYLATDTRLEREVAIAVIRTDGIDDLALARVRQEARAMGRLGDHPHIVTVFDVGDAERQPYIVSQYMSGGSVDDLLRAAPEHRLPIEQAVRIAEQVTRALERAHELRIVHRDVKPGNVWLTADGTAKLGDFGLALVADRARLTLEGTIVGTVTYMAPEQALGRSLDGRADLYALGAMLYEMVCGRPPFLGDNAVAIVSQHLSAEPVAPSWHNPAVPALLESLILRLLAKTPAERPSSATVVRDALASIATLPEPRGATAGPAANPLDRLAGAVFVGRAREMEELRAAVDDARTGHGRLALISGEAGIGKTRTASEIGTYARMRGFQVLWGRANETDGAPAYWPWVQLVRAWLAERDTQTIRAELGAGASEIAALVPELRDVVADVPSPPPVDPEQARFRLFDAVATFLRNAGARQPLVLVLDDVHWADASSLLLLEFVAGQIESARVLVLATYRDGELGRHHPLLHTLGELARAPVTRRVPLQGLTAEDVARYIELTAATTAPPALVAAVHAETEGNPFFVGEVVRLLAAEGRLGETEPRGDWKLNVPQGVREVLGRRLGRLSPGCNELLTMAAVVGREFGLDVLEPVTARAADELLETLEEAIGARLVVRTGDVVARFRFAHALVRETLYDDLGPARRVRLHQEVAEALEAIHEARPERHLAELAYHYARAAVTTRLAEKAIAYARRAGARAVAQLAYEEGARLHRIALDLLASHGTGDDDGTRGEILLELGEAERRAGDVETAKSAFREAAEVARGLDLPELLARAALAYAGPGFVFGRHDPLEASLLEEAVRRLDVADGIVRAKILARLTMARFFEGDADGAVRLSVEAVEMARRLGDPATLAYALHARHVAIWSPASVEERLVVATEMLRVAEAAGDREEIGRARHLRIVDLLELGDLIAAYREMDVQSKLADDLRQPLFQWHRAMYRTLRALLEGRFAEGERLAQETLAIGQKASPDAMDTFAVQAFQVWREQGRMSELEAALTAFVLEQPAVVTWRGVLSYILLEAGHEPEGRREFERLAADAFPLPTDPVWSTGMSMLCEACVILGDAARARILHDRLAPYAQRLVIVGAGVVCNGPVSLYLGMLDTVMGRWDEATEHLESARAASARIGSPPWLARTALAEARLLLARDAPDDRERAVRRADEVIEIARELGMTMVLEKATALRAAAGAAAAPTSDRPVGPAADDRPVFRCEGEYWTLAFEGRICRLKDAKGLHHIAELLRHPGERFEARALVGGTGPVAATPRAASADASVRADLGDAGTVLDARAKDEYRRRLAELREELAEAEAFNDPGRAEMARAEIELITRQLSTAVGIGGRDRKVASASERARLTVTKRIKDALARIAESHPPLGQYLGARIKTGYLCSYVPDPRHPMVWDVVA